MAVNGKVITGFSMPRYSVITEGARTAAALARGVSVSLSIETGDETIFRADNGTAESVGAPFTGGTVTLTVDGLHEAAANAISGRTAGGGWTEYKSTDEFPYVSVGFIVRYMSEGVTSYVPVILAKVKFSEPGLEAATQEEAIDFQTQQLEATIFENDSYVWKYVGDAESSEADALTALDTKIVTA